MAIFNQVGGGGFIKYKDQWLSVSTLPYDFDGGAAVVLNGEIHILGGYSSDHPETYRNHYKWDGSKWTSVSTLPYDFYEGSAVVLNGEIHILGADSFNQKEEYRNHYKWDGSKWTKVSTLPSDDSGIGGITVFNGEIFITYDDNSSTRLYKWNGSEWTMISLFITPDKTSLYTNYLIPLNNEIHDFGSNGSFRFHYKYDGTNWSEVSTPPYCIYKSGCVFYNGKFHVLGGKYNKRDHYALEELYIKA
jgi:hypothetical protein